MEQSKIQYWYVPNFSEFFDKNAKSGYTVHAQYNGNERFLCGVKPYGNSTQTPQKDYTVCPKCKALKDADLTFECTQAGQVRRYGDTRYEFTVTFVGTGETPTNEAVYEICQKFIHPARDGKDVHPLIDSVLEFIQTKPGTWRYITGHYYTD